MPKCRCASSFGSRDVDLVVTAAYRMVCCDETTNLIVISGEKWERSKLFKTCGYLLNSEELQPKLIMARVFTHSIEIKGTNWPYIFS